MTRRVVITADHGTAIIYFLQSEVVPTLLDAGVDVTVLTDDETRAHIAAKFAREGLHFEGLRLELAETYARTFQPRLQWLLGYLRRVGGSRRMNTAAMDSHIWEVWTENSWRFRMGVWLPAALAILLLRISRFARKALVQIQMHYVRRGGIYSDLFDRLRPNLVITSTPGWRMDRYFLREAHLRQIPTVSSIVGWDNPSSYAVPGAAVDWATCWSQAQRQELVLGSDWAPSRVHIGGIPSYDGYLRRSWLSSREEYFKLHGLDPQRRLISYASSFVHFAPNLPNIQALARLVAAEALEQPAQLLIRLHPSHFQDKPRIFAEERRQIDILAATSPHVHVVQPVPLGGSLGYYGGEDMEEKASMMAHSDVLVTVYSTMLVETAIHDTPMIAVTLDVPGGWNVPLKYSLALKEIGSWPTHKRFREAGAGRVASTEQELRHWLNTYLNSPELDREARRRFVADEITFTDGSAGRRTAEFFLELLERASNLAPEAA